MLPCPLELKYHQLFHLFFEGLDLLLFFMFYHQLCYDFFIAGIVNMGKYYIIVVLAHRS